MSENVFSALAEALGGVAGLLAADDGKVEPPGWTQWGMFVPLGIMLILFLVMSNRTRRKQERDRQEMLDSLKRGDRIQTIGGIVGTVVEAKPHEVVVKVDETSNTKIRFVRSAIHKVVDAEAPADSARDK